MDSIMTYLLLSPLYPLKGKIASNMSQNKLATITPPAGGLWVSKYNNKLFP